MPLIKSDAFNKVGGTPIDINGSYWSSTEINDNSAWRTKFSASYGLTGQYKSNISVVWPVIEF